MRFFRTSMRQSGWLVFFILTLAALATQPNVLPGYASDQTLFFKSNQGGGFEPVGIDFAHRLGEPGLLNEARMLITRPLDGNPRELQQRDADATSFSLRATLDPRPNNQTAFVDSVAVVPRGLGVTQTPGGWEPNTALVTQGLSVFKVSGAGAGPVQATLVATIPVASSQCPSPNSAIVFDRWALQFGGDAIVTFGNGSTCFEAWRVPSGGAASLLRRITGVAITGRPDITSPNFTGVGPACGGCLAVPSDDGQVHIINGSGNTVQTIGSAGALSRRIALTVPPRVHNFGTSAACLFGTVPSDNQIMQFPCSEVAPFLIGFNNTASGDLLVFAATGAVRRVRATDGDVASAHTGAGAYEDLAFTPLSRGIIEVVQPSLKNPNPGEQGKVKFYILTGPGFTDPLSVLDLTSLRIGSTGTEAPVTCKAVGVDKNGDEHPDPQCEANSVLANCDAPLICILTGFTLNQGAFEAD